MRFGVREICDVVLRAKAAQKIGNKIFYKNEPVIYFDSLKTSSLEGAATTVYAQGGRGNARLVAWEGERTVTFTMEDALISPAGFMILSGAGLIEASDKAPIYVHSTEQLVLKGAADGEEANFTNEADSVTITISKQPATPNAGEDFIYVMLLDDRGEVSTEPYIATLVDGGSDTEGYKIKIAADTTRQPQYSILDEEGDGAAHKLANFKAGAVVLVDYYVKKISNAQQIEITADKFGGNYYLEASTLFRNTDGVDMPAEFIIPNCKIQSNFTFTMASSGDPSTFTFTMDAFPDYTRFNKEKKVLAAIQIIEDGGADDKLLRASTIHAAADELKFD